MTTDTLLPNALLQSITINNVITALLFFPFG